MSGENETRELSRESDNPVGDNQGQTAESTTSGRGIDTLKERTLPTEKIRGFGNSKSTSEEGMSTDTVFTILENERRRLTLQYLEEHENPVTLGELAKYIAATENDKTTEEVSSEERKRTYIGLYQSHLPKMDELGVIEFDSDRGFIRVNDSTDELLEYLNTEDPSSEWSIRYLGLVGAGALLLLVAATFLSPTDPVVVVLAGLVILAIGVLAAAHRYTEWSEGGSH